jgi:phosphatidylinositol alpha 1,6-mannosyltransferase
MLGPFIWCELRRLHDAADLTLVHSAETLGELEARGFTLMALWRRGVDTDRFHPGHRDERLRPPRCAGR